MADIHPTALVHATAEILDNAVVGPYCIVGPRCVVGAGTRLDPYVHLKEDVRLGADNRVHTGAVLGDAPQHLKYTGHQACVLIGDRNTFREHVTVHKPFEPEGVTQIGDDGFFMTGSHVGHDAHVGHRVIMANASALGGHAILGDGVNLSSHIGVHQFGRIGRLAMIGGVSRVAADVPPFCMSVGGRLRGLNAIGMKRAGIAQRARSQVKCVFKTIFGEGRALTTGVESARKLLAEWGDTASPEAAQFVEFVAARSRRPIMRYVGGGTDDDE